MYMYNICTYTVFPTISRAWKTTWHRRGRCQGCCCLPLRALGAMESTICYSANGSGGASTAIPPGYQGNQWLQNFVFFFGANFGFRPEFLCKMCSHPSPVESPRIEASAFSTVTWRRPPQILRGVLWYPVVLWLAECCKSEVLMVLIFIG